MLQVVEEGIRAGNVPAVLDKCINDLLDLTDLVRGKLGVQVRPCSSKALCYQEAIMVVKPRALIQFPTASQYVTSHMQGNI